MNGQGEQIKQWLQAAEAQAPLLVVGQNESELEQMIEEVIQQATADQWVAINDIERLSTTTRSISIKQVRTFLSRLRLKPIKQKRIFYIKQAHLLGQAAASMLLKNLEEAPDSTRYILTTKWPGRLLITIRSRCTLMSVKNMSDRTGTDRNLKLRSELSAKLNSADSVSHDEIMGVAQYVDEELAENGPSRDLKILLLRLVDYYRIKEKGGNEKLAKEVLLAHLGGEQK